MMTRRARATMTVTTWPFPTRTNGGLKTHCRQAHWQAGDFPKTELCYTIMRYNPTPGCMER